MLRIRIGWGESILHSLPYSLSGPPISQHRTYASARFLLTATLRGSCSAASVACEAADYSRAAGSASLI
jgi:hypothetical protein